MNTCTMYSFYSYSWFPHRPNVDHRRKRCFPDLIDQKLSRIMYARQWKSNGNDGKRLPLKFKRETSIHNHKFNFIQSIRDPSVNFDEGSFERSYIFIQVSNYVIRQKCTIRKIFIEKHSNLGDNTCHFREWYFGWSFDYANNFSDVTQSSLFQPMSANFEYGGIFL